MMSVLLVISSTSFAQNELSSAAQNEKAITEKQGIRALFKAMPDSLCYLLTAVNRADCIDFLDSQMAAKVTNRLNKTSQMTILNDRYLHLQLTPNSEFSLRLLPLRNGHPLLCVVRTVQAKVKDSSVSFYNTDWQLLPTAKYLKMPTEPNYFVEAQLSPDHNNITFHYTSLLTLGEQKKDPYLPTTYEKKDSLSSVVYHWNGKQYISNKKNKE
jgi:hypothetical protein